MSRAQAARKLIVYSNLNNKEKSQTQHITTITTQDVSFTTLEYLEKNISHN